MNCTFYQWSVFQGKHKDFESKMLWCQSLPLHADCSYLLLTCMWCLALWHAAEPFPPEQHWRPSPPQRQSVWQAAGCPGRSRSPRPPPARGDDLSDRTFDMLSNKAVRPDWAWGPGDAATFPSEPTCASRKSSTFWMSWSEGEMRYFQ